MIPKLRMWICVILSISILSTGLIHISIGDAIGAANGASNEAGDEQQFSEKDKKPGLSLPEDMGESLVREAARVRDEFEHQTQSMFKRNPLGWNLETIRYLYEKGVSLPREIPKITEHLMEQGRMLGTVGSVLILIFIIVTYYYFQT